MLDVGTVATAIAELPYRLGSILAQIDNPGPAAPDGLATESSKWISWAKWGVALAGVIGILISAGMMIIGRRNRSQTAVDGAIGLPWVIGGLSLVVVAVGIVNAMV